LKSFPRYHVIPRDNSLSSCHWYAEFIARISVRRGLPRTYIGPYIRSRLEAYWYDQTSLWRYWPTGCNASCRMSPCHKRHAHIRDRPREWSDFGPCANQETLRLFALYCKPTVHSSRDWTRRIRELCGKSSWLTFLGHRCVRRPICMGRSVWRRQYTGGWCTHLHLSDDRREHYAEADSAVTRSVDLDGA